ncbi:MAG TPA: barstar family protein, partial [Dermatophilaceae bacterium]|nr:barstar family protein [Dermatophilaceae bacterium]
GPARRSTYAAIAAALGFPDWFGHNADALYDCLRDWAADGHRRALVLDGLGDLERADAPGAALICAVLDDIEAVKPQVLMVVVDR